VYVDEIYDALFVNRAKDLGTGLWNFDGAVVDGVVNGAASSTVQSALGRAGGSLDRRRSGSILWRFF